MIIIKQKISLHHTSLNNKHNCVAYLRSKFIHFSNKPFIFILQCFVGNL